MPRGTVFLGAKWWIVTVALEALAVALVYAVWPQGWHWLTYCEHGVRAAGDSCDRPNIIVLFAPLGLPIAAEALAWQLRARADRRAGSRSDLDDVFGR